MATFENQNYENEIATLTNTNYINCTFNNLDIGGSTINNCGFECCEFFSCDLSNIVFLNSFIEDCNFSQCKLLGFNWKNIKKSMFNNPFSSLDKCNLKFNIFSKLVLKKFIFRECNLSDAIFDNCNLENAVFDNCLLDRCILEHNNLTKSDFRTASNYYFDLSINNMRKAKFTYPQVLNFFSKYDIDVTN
jgi:uncharacterized protein YjbI with pentapeptide repeats